MTDINTVDSHVLHLPKIILALLKTLITELIILSKLNYRFQLTFLPSANKSNGNVFVIGIYDLVDGLVIDD